MIRERLAMFNVLEFLCCLLSTFVFINLKQYLFCLVRFFFCLKGSLLLRPETRAVEKELSNSAQCTVPF